MSLLWCLCGIATAFVIGRYNQSNKLFWMLFTSFMIGIAGAAVYNKIQFDQSEVRTTQVYPTQDVSVAKNVTFGTEQVMCNVPTPVGKEVIPEYCSNIVGVQWVKQPIIPPPRKS